MESEGDSLSSKVSYELFRNNYERFYERSINDLLFDLCHENAQ